MFEIIDPLVADISNASLVFCMVGGNVVRVTLGWQLKRIKAIPFASVVVRADVFRIIPGATLNTRLWNGLGKP